MLFLAPGPAEPQDNQHFPFAGGWHTLSPERGCRTLCEAFADQIAERFAVNGFAFERGFCGFYYRAHLLHGIGAGFGNCFFCWGGFFFCGWVVWVGGC